MTPPSGLAALDVMAITAKIVADLPVGAAAQLMPTVANIDSLLTVAAGLGFLLPPPARAGLHDLRQILSVARIVLAKAAQAEQESTP